MQSATVRSIRLKVVWHAAGVLAWLWLAALCTYRGVAPPTQRPIPSSSFPPPRQLTPFSQSYSGGVEFTYDFDVAGVRIPFGVVFFASSILLTLWLLSLARRQPEPGAEGEGHCIACGYDLRATPDRCPECGAIKTG